MVYIGPNPIVLLVIALLIPLVYSYFWKRRELGKMGLLFLTGIVIVLMYPMVTTLSEYPGGYLVGKFVIFVIFPVLALMYIEKWKIVDILPKVGLQRAGLERSVLYGLGAAVITISITMVASTMITPDLVYKIILFFEAFTEEFFFRGVLFLYLLKKTNVKVAALTSIIGFILIHPQNFEKLFIVSTAAQGVLMTWVAHKTKNIIGPWIGHGLNRLVPTVIRVLVGG